MNVPVIIPTFDPKENILSVIEGLTAKGFSRIVIIDDGSAAECAPLFEKIEAMPQCVLLRHEKNCGKGRGLKTGFRYVLENLSDCDGVVTTDDDGQHTPDDILRCAEKMAETGKAVLGARDFSGSDIPPKSRFGNNMTRFVFRFLCGIRISDTQTGLRALPIGYIEHFTELSGERFEYETNMLLEMKRLSLPFIEERIATIYSENNRGTHFDPLTDSVKIYAVILKFMLSSAICSIIDIGLFTALNLSLIPFFSDEKLRILVSTAGARAVSSLVNFMINKHRVFRSGQNIRKSMIRYYILCAAQLTLSWLCVSGLSLLFGAEKNLWQTLIKVIADTLLFLVSFGIQRDWVYK